MAVLDGGGDVPTSELSNVPAVEQDPVALGQKGVPLGIATLDASGKVPAGQLPPSGGVSLTEVLLLKSFFSNLGFLPSVVIREDLYTFPASDFANLNGGTPTIKPGRLDFVGVGNPANLGWDLGVQYSKVLFIVGGFMSSSFNGGIFLGKTLPATTAPHDAYYFAQDPTSAKFTLFEFSPVGGVTDIGSGVRIAPSGLPQQPNYAMGLYIDGSTGEIFCAVRVGTEMWWQLMDVIDPTVATFRYAGLFFSINGGQTQIANCPVAIYADL
ncbi:MAG: hypothetical protein ACREYE_22240 [Gammaproteobacteria bacterium]